MQNIRTLGKTAASSFKSATRRIAQVLNRTFTRVVQDECVDSAAQVSFFFVLSTFPFFLILAAIIGFLPTTKLWEPFVEWMFAYFPRLADSSFLDNVLALSKWHTGLFSFGLITALWSASSGFVNLMEALSLAYGAKDTRGYWKKRAIALATTIGAALFILLSFALWTFGHWAHGTIADLYKRFAVLESPWKVFWWLFTLFLVCLGTDLINYFLPNCPRPWRWLSPGTVLVALTFVLASVGLNFYVRHNLSLPKIYGTLAGFIVFMLWIYIVILILLIGAETDTAMSEIRKGTCHEQS